MAFLLQRLGNHLFERCFPIYRPVYSAYKAIADRAERQLLREHLRPGMIVVDAGANIGVYSRFMAELVGSTGKLHAFEPSPKNFAQLRVASESYAQIICNQIAVGAESKDMILYVSNSLNVDHRMYAPPGEARPGIVIRCVRLDDYFPAGTVIDFIKADIQGYELQALRGAERTIEENRILKLVLEFWPHGLKAAGTEPEALPRFLTERGFDVLKIGRNGRLMGLAKSDFQTVESNYCNLFATRS